MSDPRPLPTQAEIAVLEALADEREVLSARVAGGTLLFRGTLLHVDRGREFLVLARSGDPRVDEALFAEPAVEFFAEWGEWRIAFPALGPQAACHEGEDAVRAGFPSTVSIARRRMFERAPVAEGSLRCVAFSGSVPVFEAAVTNISQGGLGLLVETAGDFLVPGMVLPGCRLEGARGASATVDLEVRHTAVATGPDGRRAVRAGCRFVSLSPSAMALVAAHVGTAPASPS